MVWNLEDLDSYKIIYIEVAPAQSRLYHAKVIGISRQASGNKQNTGEPSKR